MPTVNVTDNAGLLSAIANAKGDTTIILKSGDYGRVILNGDKIPSLQNNSSITIKSADPNNMASMSPVKLLNAQNVTFDSIIFDHTHVQGDSVGKINVDVRNSDNVTIVNSVFDGDTGSGFGTFQFLRCDRCDDYQQSSA